MQSGHKGILLAGGKGTRLYPSTQALSKQLLPVYDKPMVYYPLATLMEAGVRSVFLITGEQELPLYQALLQGGERWGITISYGIQKEPRGIAEALLIADSFIGDDAVFLILGDNIFLGSGWEAKAAAEQKEGATIFVHQVVDPNRFGVVEFDEAFRPLSIEEKPLLPRSSWAVTGLYHYDKRAVCKARTLVPSKRGELEITDLNQLYLQEGSLRVALLGSDYHWFDCGTHASLNDAANLIRSLEEREGRTIACLEEIAWRKGYIDEKKARLLFASMKENEYSLGWERRFSSL